MLNELLTRDIGYRSSAVVDIPAAPLILLITVDIDFDTVDQWRAF